MGIFFKELGSELRLKFLGDSSATPQNDVEFFVDSTLISATLNISPFEG